MTDPAAPDTFESYAANRDEPRFSDWLQERAEPYWTAATRHRFVKKLGDDTIDDAVFKRYLVQDYAYLETGTSAVGYAVGQAPTMDAKARLTDQLSVLTGDENDYFRRSFDALDVPEADRTDPSLTDVTKAFRDFRLRVAHESGYEETIAVTLAAEWIYLEWATFVSDTSSSRFYLEEWVELHATPDFESWVDWLREQIDRYGPELSTRRRQRLEELFQRTAELEVAFFDATYDNGTTATGERSW